MASGSDLGKRRGRRKVEEAEAAGMRSTGKEAWKGHGSANPSRRFFFPDQPQGTGSCTPQSSSSHILEQLFLGLSVGRLPVSTSLSAERRWPALRP